MVEIEEAPRVKISGYVGTTTSKYGMKLLTKLGLRLLLYLGRQRVSTTFQSFMPPFRAASKQTPLPRLQILRRAAPTRSLPPLAALQKWPSSLGWMEKRLRWLREWPLIPPSPQLLPRILPKTRRHPGWRLFLQLLHYLPKVTPKAQTKDLRSPQSPNPRPYPKEKL